MKRDIFCHFSWSRVLNSSLLTALISVVILSILGLAFVYSTSSDKLLLYNKQKMWFFISTAVFLITLQINYRFILKHIFWFYCAGIAVLLFLLISDQFVGNTKRWIKVIRFNIQPSEFMKYVLVFALANIFSRFSSKKKRTHFDIIPAFFVTFIPAGLIFLQPDMGTALVFFAILFAMAFAMGMPIRYIILTLIAVLSLIYLYGLKPYQKQRIKNFLAPILQTSISKDQQRKGLYQLSQSLNAHGSGGIMGKGWTEGSQNKFLPAKETDFIFAIIGEEMGLLGTCFVLGMYLILYISLLLTASSLRNLEAQLIVVGITSILATQTFVNIYMTIGLAPITGIPLPFISYGGSSLLTSFLGIAVITSIQGSEE